MAKRPDHEEEASNRRLARREAEIRERIAEREVDIISLGILFGQYRLNQQPDLIIPALDLIAELELMALPDHRYGIAGALVGVMGLHPDRKDGWKAHAPKLIAAAESLIPSDEAEAALTPYSIEFLFMLWMSTGDVAVLRRLFKEAHRGGAAGERATLLLETHSHLPEITAEIIRSVQTGRTVGKAPVALPPSSTVERRGVPHAEVSALSRHVAAMPDGLKRVILVGWTPAQGGTYLIYTPDGKPWSELPAEWAGRPVTTVKADEQQIAVHRQVQAQMEEP